MSPRTLQPLPVQWFHPPAVLIFRKKDAINELFKNKLAISMETKEYSFTVYFQVCLFYVLKWTIVKYNVFRESHEGNNSICGASTL